MSIYFIFDMFIAVKWLFDMTASFTLIMLIIFDMNGALIKTTFLIVKSGIN